MTLFISSLILNLQEIVAGALEAQPLFVWAVERPTWVLQAGACRWGKAGWEQMGAVRHLHDSIFFKFSG